MEFTKYSSIENHHRAAFINKMQLEGHTVPSVRYQVTEKVHGANFSFYAYKGEVGQIAVKMGKRTDFCDREFFSCGNVWDKYWEKVVELMRSLSGSNLIIYGELAGKGIQGGINYGEKDFHVFDIKVDGVYLPTDRVVRICEDFGFKHTPVRAISVAFGDAMAMNDTFISTIGGWSEADEDGKGNWAEGIVIKPIIPAYLHNGSRVVVKKVSPKFSEVGGNKVKVKKEVIPLFEIDRNLVDDLSEYLNDNRLRSVLSKVGVPEAKQFGMVMGLLVQDALAAFEKDHGIAMDNIAQEPKRVTSALNQLATGLIRPNWVNIIDGVDF